MTKTARVPLEATVSLREAKAGLSRLTREARCGTRVIITNHGTPIADLVAHGAGLARLGHLKRPGPPPEPFELQGEGPSASEQVLLDREP